MIALTVSVFVFCWFSFIMAFYYYDLRHNSKENGYKMIVVSPGSLLFFYGHISGYREASLLVKDGECLFTILCALEFLIETFAYAIFKKKGIVDNNKWIFIICGILLINSIIWVCFTCFIEKKVIQLKNNSSNTGYGYKNLIKYCKKQLQLMTKDEKTFVLVKKQKKTLFSQKDEWYIVDKNASQKRKPIMVAFCYSFRYAAHPQIQLFDIAEQIETRRS